jgi:hypothetical protein
MRMYGGDEAFLNKSFKLGDPEWDRLSDLFRQAALTSLPMARGGHADCVARCPLAISKKGSATDT